MLDFELSKENKAKALMYYLIGIIAKFPFSHSNDKLSYLNNLFQIEISNNKIKEIYDIAEKDNNDLTYYARKIKLLYPENNRITNELIIKLLEFANITSIEEKKIQFLRNISNGFGVSKEEFREILKFHLLPTNNNNYEILGINKKANKDILKKQYHKLIKDCHPDKVINSDDDIAWLANEKFMKISAAYKQVSKKRKFI